MVLGLGRVAGAVYKPAELMAPAVELPPRTLLTDHVTDVSVAPVTAAVNCWELPARTLAGFGVIDTCTVPEEGELGEVREPLTAPHPTCNPTSNERRTRRMRCKESSNRSATAICRYASMWLG